MSAKEISTPDYFKILKNVVDKCIYGARKQRI